MSHHDHPLATRLAGIAFVFALSAAPAPPAGASSYRAYGGISGQYNNSPGSDFGHYDRTGFNTTGGQVNYNSPGGYIAGLSITGQADSLGGTGFLSAHDYAQLISSNENPIDGNFSLDSESTINASWTDVTVLGPAGAGRIGTTIHFHLDGSLINGTTPVAGRTTTANNFVGINIATDTLTLGTGNFYWVSQNGSPPAKFLSSGILTNLTGNDDLAVSLIVTPNEPFTLNVQLQTNASVNGPTNHGIILDANTEFSHTFSFATDRPVFDLPAGYTANSLDAGIANNVYTLPTPEPTAAALAGLLPALLLVRRTRRCRH